MPTSLPKPVLVASAVVLAAGLACSALAPNPSAAMTATPTPPANILPPEFATLLPPEFATLLPPDFTFQPGVTPTPFVYTPPSGTLPPPAATLPAAPPNVLANEEQLLIRLYEQVSPGVVSIQTQGSSPLDAGQGSGFVIDRDGHIVTNQHVIANATRIEVRFADGTRALGRVLGADQDSDLAVVKVDVPANRLTPLPLADSSQVKVGQRVVAIGNPFGLSGTMTLGIVSGLGRSLSSRRVTAGGNFTAPDMIQTDAPVNPGNSGGPLLNLNGEVIGVNRAIATETGVNSGIAYAISSNTARQIVPFLIRDGRFVYPYLGISSLEELTLDLQNQLGLPQARGAYVTSVVPNGPAAQAGLRGDSGSSGQPRGNGDLIIAINGTPVNVFSDLIAYLVLNTRPGDTVTLTVLRQGQQRDFQVTLGERP